MAKSHTGSRSAPASSRRHTRIPLEHSLNRAIDCHQRGDLSTAARLYQDIAVAEPHHADVHFLLGTVYAQLGQFTSAIACLQTARDLRPGHGQTVNNLGLAYQEIGDTAAAEDCFTRAIACAPDLAEAHGNLGNLLLETGRTSQAIRRLEEAVKIHPDYVVGYNNLGIALVEAGNDDEAEDAFEHALRLRSTYLAARINLAKLCETRGRLKEAEDHYRLALQLDPTMAESHFRLGVVQNQLGNRTAARDSFLRAAELDPGYVDAHNNLAAIALEEGRPGDALIYSSRALDREPCHAAAYINRGSALQQQGRILEAMTCFSRAIEIEPDNPTAYSNLLLNINYHADIDRLEIARTHQQCGLLFSAGIRQMRIDERATRTSDRLRVGYVSADFRRHSVSYFLKNLFRHHDRRHVEVFCYGNNAQHDDVTAEIRELADHWRDIHHLGDDATADLIQGDAIDVLVDLSGHMAGNRLAVFARRPCATQITFLGYPNTTGVPALDYRLTDAIADPDDREASQLCSERLVRLPHCFLCYSPPNEAPEIGPLPALHNGYITFGSFNNLAKTNLTVISAWSKILHAMPASRLILKSKGLADTETREHVQELFLQFGIESRRLELLGWTGTSESHLDAYNKVDIALDTFPYNGTTTTCEALWMGVPVITLLGDRHAARVGASLLTNTGLSRFIAEDVSHYISTAVELTSDLENLASIRQSLRRQIAEGPLCNGTQYAQDIESIYLGLVRHRASRGLE